MTISLGITMQNIEYHDPIWKWTPDEKHKVALKYKIEGIELFKAKRYIDAFYTFSKACKILITLEPVDDLELDATLKANITKLRIILYNNMAACQLHQKNYDQVIELCDKVIEREKGNVKALYRRGVAHVYLRDVEKAVSDMKAVLRIQATNTEAQEHLRTLNIQLEKANFEYENIVKRMFKRK